MALLFRQVSERADDERVFLGSEFGPHGRSTPLRNEFLGAQGVVQHGNLVGLDSLIDEMLLYGMRYGKQMRLVVVPPRRRKALDMSN